MNTDNLLKEKLISNLYRDELDKILYPIIDLLREHEDDRVIKIRLAGGCFCNKINDYDIFLDAQQSCRIRDICETYNCLSRLYKCKYRDNCLTVYTSTKTIQFLTYSCNKDIYGLINSFDFAHIQIGCVAQFEYNRENNACNIYIDTLVYTADFITAKMTNSTFYTGSDYPLSSMIRLNKYAERGLLSKREYRREFVKILTNFIDRRFYDYDDFKDQLQSIDLALEGPECFDLWHAVEEAGLVMEACYDE